MLAPETRSKRAVLRKLTAEYHRFQNYYSALGDDEAIQADVDARPELWALYRWVEKALQAQGVDLDAPTTLQ